MTFDQAPPGMHASPSGTEAAQKLLRMGLEWRCGLGHARLLPAHAQARAPGPQKPPAIKLVCDAQAFEAVASSSSSAPSVMDLMSDLQKALAQAESSRQRAERSEMALNDPKSHK